MSIEPSILISKTIFCFLVQSFILRYQTLILLHPIFKTLFILFSCFQRALKTHLKPSFGFLARYYLQHLHVITRITALICIETRPTTPNRAQPRPITRYYVCLMFTIYPILSNVFLASFLEQTLLFIHQNSESFR